MKSKKKACRQTATISPTGQMQIQALIVIPHSIFHQEPSYKCTKDDHVKTEMSQTNERKIIERCTACLWTSHIVNSKHNIWDDVPYFDNIAMTLSLDSKGEFYKLITDNYKCFCMIDLTTTIKEKVTKNNTVVKIQYLTTVLRNPQNKQQGIITTLAQLHLNYAREWQGLTVFLDQELKWQFNPYHTKGYSQLVSTSTKHDYSCNCSKCSSMPSRTIVLYWVFGSKIDSRRCYPLFIILYIFLRWGHSFLVYIVPYSVIQQRKWKPRSWANKNSSLDSIFKGPDNFDC